MMNLNPKNASVPLFVQKLWDILEAKQDPQCLEWTEAGQSFIIKDKQVLCSSILPKYFKHSNLSSFIRQLNMYNFRKIRMSKHENEFSHNLFRKNQRQLLIGIKRKPSQAEVEFGNQLICKLGLQKTASNTDSADLVKKEAAEEHEIVADEVEPIETPNEEERQVENLRYQNAFLWNHYCKNMQQTSLIVDKVYKFLAATYFNGSFCQSAPHPSSLNFLLSHLTSSQPAYSSDQYQNMTSSGSSIPAFQIQPVSLTNVHKFSKVDHLEEAMLLLSLFRKSLDNINSILFFK